MGKIEIHGPFPSQPTRAVVILCELIGLPYELIQFDPHVKTPEFKKLNPQQLVPVLVDDGLVVQESRAIMRYLMDKYAKDDSLYPKDLKARAIINARLDFGLGTLWARAYPTYRPTFASGTPSEEGVQSVKQAISILEDFLSRDKWIAGPNMTIADISFGTIITMLQIVKFDFTPYPNVRRWLDELKKVEIFRKLDEKGVAELQELFPNLK